MIDMFLGKYGFLSNFAPSHIIYGGLDWPTAEHLFQGCKTVDPEIRRKVAKAESPAKAKRMGRQVELRTNWEEIKEQIMYRTVWLKFVQNEGRAALLIQTGDQTIVEGNTWHDNIWGQCLCQSCREQHIEGRNLLGKILMKVRDALRRADDASYIHANLTLNDYQCQATQTSIYPDVGYNHKYPTLGLCGESGEVAEKVKKIDRDHFGQINDEITKDIKKELGGVLWYLSQTAREFGLSLGEIAQYNLDQLNSRAERGKLHGDGDDR